MAYSGIALVMIILTVASFTANGFTLFTLGVGFITFLAMAAAGSEISSNRGTENSSEEEQDSGGILSSLFGIGDSIHQATEGARGAIETHQEQIEAGAEIAGNALGEARQRLGDVFDRQQEEEEEMGDVAQEFQDEFVTGGIAKDISEIKEVEKLLEAAIEEDNSKLEEIIEGLNEAKEVEEGVKKLRDVKKKLKELEKFLEQHNPYEEPDYEQERDEYLSNLRDTGIFDESIDLALNRFREKLEEADEKILEVTSNDPYTILEKLHRTIEEQELQEEKIEKIAHKLSNRDLFNKDRELERGTEEIEEALRELLELYNEFEDLERESIRKSWESINKERQLLQKIEDIVEDEGNIARMARENDDIEVLEDLRELDEILIKLADFVNQDLEIEESWLEKINSGINTLDPDIDIENFENSLMEEKSSLQNLGDLLESKKEEIDKNIAHEKERILKARKMVENRIMLYYHLSGDDYVVSPEEVLDQEESSEIESIDRAVRILQLTTGQFKKAKKISSEEIDQKFDYTEQINKMEKMEKEIEKMAKELGIFKKGRLRRNLDKKKTLNKVLNTAGFGRKFFSTEDLKKITEAEKNRGRTQL